MRIDKDRPSTWRQYKNGMCNGCRAGCCTMPVEVRIEDLLRLGLVTEDEVDHSIKKIVKKLNKEGILKSYRESTGLFMFVQRENGDCIFLDDKTRLCKHYEKRPQVCRDFPNIGPRPGFCPCTQK